MLEGETDFKKMYREHVQGHIDLKKHVNSIEAEKMKKLQEFSHSQNCFLRKYNKYVDGSLHPSKRKTTGLNTPTPLPGIPSPGRRKSVGDISVTKNLAATMPVDSPYSLDSWHALVNNGCRDSTEQDPIERIREQLVREPLPEVQSLDEESIPSSPSVPTETTVRVKRRLSRDYTSLDGAMEKVVKKQQSRRFSLDMSDNKILLRREQTDIPKSCLKTSPGTPRKVRNKHVTVISEADSDDRNLTLETTKVTKLPNIEQARALTQTGSDRVGESGPPSTPATWSGLKPRVRRGRSNSLAPNMLESFQKSKSLMSSTIEEQDETRVMKTVRSNSSGEIDKIRNNLSTTIKETATMEKAALQIMIENSKGINKFKYLTKMVNVGLKEMKHSDNKPTKQDQACYQDIVACRYLRMPRGSISGTPCDTYVP